MLEALKPILQLEQITHLEEQITTAELRCSNLGYKFVQLKEERHKQKKRRALELRTSRFFSNCKIGLEQKKSCCN